MKKVKSTLVLFLIFSFVFVSFSQVEVVKAQPNIFIRVDGTVEGTDKIEQAGNVYYFTDNVTGSVAVEKDDIIIDGAGFTLSANSGHGFQLDYRHNVTVKNIVINDTYCAFDLTFADNNIITGNTIINSERAVYVWFSWRNNITKNTISGVTYAFEFFMSPNHWSEENVIAGNTVLDSSVGIMLMESNNTFSDNIINSSNLGVSISGHQNLFRNNTINCPQITFKDTGFDNNIDESNLVNGKPIIYWVGQQNKVVPSEAGYVLLSNCKNVTVQNLHVCGVDVASTVDCVIAGNTILGGYSGVQLLDCSNITVAGNLVLDNWFGLTVTNCEDNIIVGNNFSNNSYYGVLLDDSNYNTLKQNTVANNGFEEEYDIVYESYSGDVFGVKILGSSNNLLTENNVTCNNQWGIRVLGIQHDNVLYNNNFIDNKVNDVMQVSMLGSSMNMPANHSIWDNGTIGNYWSDYLNRYPNASEVGAAGIGDTAYYINENNIDHYPLMNPVDIEVVPEFPSWPLLPIFAAATLSALIIKKKLVRCPS